MDSKLSVMQTVCDQALLESQRHQQSMVALLREMTELASALDIDEKIEVSY